MKTLSLLGLALVAWAIAPGTAPAQEPAWNWKGAVAAGKSIEIKGVNGDIRATAGPGSEVVVTAVKKGRKSDPSTVTIEVVNSAAGVTICAVYPSNGKKANRCAPCDEGTMNTNDNDVNVDFTVQVPAGVKFAGHTVNGAVGTERLGSDAEVSTVNGDIRVVAAGVVRATTVNGSVDVSMGKADWSGTVHLSTVNGSIRAKHHSQQCPDDQREHRQWEHRVGVPANDRGQVRPPQHSRHDRLRRPHARPRHGQREHHPRQGLVRAETWGRPDTSGHDPLHL